MDIEKIAKNNENKLKYIFRSFAGRFTRMQHLLITAALVIIMLVLCIWVFSLPVKLFIYYVLLALFGFQFAISWFTHAEKYAKGESEEADEDKDLAAETADTIEQHRRRRTSQS